jgi:uncharacterized protein YfaS (alpha-2-macroglobulin family)
MSHPSATITVGNVARATVEFRDLAGALTDPTTVTARTLEPDGTVVTTYTFGVDAALTNPSVGVYVLEWALTETGQWAVRFEGTGALQAAVEGHVEVPCSPFVPA